MNLSVLSSFDPRLLDPADSLWSRFQYRFESGQWQVSAGPLPVDATRSAAGGYGRGDGSSPRSLVCRAS